MKMSKEAISVAAVFFGLATLFLLVVFVALLRSGTLYPPKPEPQQYTLCQSSNMGRNLCVTGDEVLIRRALQLGVLGYAI